MQGAALVGNDHRERAISVVLIDRYAMVCEGLSRILAAETDIVVAGSSSDRAEALTLIARTRPDIVILDADLPQVEETTQRIAMDAPAPAVLILSATDDPLRALTLVRAGARGYLSKQATGQDLVAAIQALGHGELALGSSVLTTVIDQLFRHKPGLAGAGALRREALSERELEVLGLLCQGRADKQIAQQLYLSVRTVNSHVSHIYAKLGVSTRTEAMHLALQHGLVTLSPTPLLAEHSEK